MFAVLVETQRVSNLKLQQCPFSGALGGISWQLPAMVCVLVWVGLGVHAAVTTHHAQSRNKPNTSHGLHRKIDRSVAASPATAFDSLKAWEEALVAY